MRQTLNNCILAVGILCLSYYLGMGFAVNFRQSMLWLWPLAALVCFVRYALVRHSIVTGLPVPLPGWFITLWRCALIAGFSFFFFVEAFVVSGSFRKAPEELPCIIVLGAKVNVTTPSGALDQRIRAAAAYLEANPDTLCIASGGQGEDEGISEAQCIHENLVELGIEPERILLEDKSTNTVENIEYSLPLLPDGVTDIGIVTSDFHVFRALCSARDVAALNYYGIPARSTPWGYVHYAVREFCAIVVSTLEGNLTF